MLVTCTNCAKTFEKNITAANDSKTNHFCTRSCSASCISTLVVID